MHIIFFQSQKWCFQIVSLLQPVVENPKTLYLLPEITEKSRKTWHLRINKGLIILH